MGIDRPSGTENPVEDADKPQPPERPPEPPPDRPGQPGFPSRSDSRTAARQAQEARAAELEPQRTAAAENGTGQPEARDEEPDESSPTEPTGEQQNDQEGQEQAEAADKARKTGTGLGERDAAHPEPETVEELRPDESEAQPGAAETGELPSQPDAEKSDSDQDEEAAPLPDKNAAEEPDPPIKAEAADDRPGAPEAEPGTGEARTAAGPGEASAARDAGEAAPRSEDERGQSETQDHQRPSQQGGQPPGTKVSQEFTSTGGSEASFVHPERPVSRVGQDQGDRLNASADRPQYPEIADRSDYVFTEREYAFAEVSPEEVWDMHTQRVPLGISADQWNECVAELHEALAEEAIDDADVRLQGSGAHFCSENPKKWFPQNEDELRARVAEHYRNAPEEERIQRVGSAVAVYREAGFSQDGPKPAAPFFDSMYKLGAATEASDYDFQIASDGLARRFQELEKSAPDVEWRSQHGGHFKHRHLEQAAPALHAWAQRWENAFDREVTLATFDGQGPSTGMREDDWVIIECEESP